MKIDGLQKLTLLDYPGKVACTVFIHGCNFRCPFCHNASLVVRPSENDITLTELEKFFKKRGKILDGVCVTGGEPLLQSDIAELFRLIKYFGYLAKLDTNGSRPELLKALVAEGLVDYVAMDIKSSRMGYESAVGIAGFDMEPIHESVSFLKSGAVEHEFRTTVVKELHNDDDFEDIGRWLEGEKSYFLQQFVDSGDIISSGMHAAENDAMKRFLSVVRKYLPSAELRGM